MKRKIKYHFDNLMSRGTGALILSLALATFFMICVVSFIVWITDSAEGASFAELLWLGFQRSLDPSLVCDDNGCVIFISSMLLIALGGVFIFSILIGLITNGISRKLSALQKGHSAVIETNHTVILGWSNQIFTILSELIKANSNQKHACIVVLSPLDKAEMDESIRHRIKNRNGTRIVTRNGSPLDLDDLKLLSLQTANSILINEKDDANVIKVLLALAHTPMVCEKVNTIVAVLHEKKNIEIARIVTCDHALLIQENLIISRIIAQTCRQSGLSAVYTELLDYDGDEMYIRSFPELTGKTYGEALFRFETSAVIGLKSKTSIRLNPPMDTVLNAGDELIAVTMDDNTFLLDADSPIPIQEHAIALKASPPAQPERILLLGWNHNARQIIEELDHYVAPGSRITVATNLPRAKTELPFVQHLLRNLTLSLVEEDITDRATLDSLLAEDYPHVILLSDRILEDVQKADANTLITLLHLRNIAERTGKSFSIVSEMLDLRNRRLAEVAKVNDFIVSETIISLMVSQVSETKSLNAVFEDIFNADGSELYIKPIGEYIDTGEPVNFYTVLEAARRKSETAFGYKIALEAQQNLPNSGIHINPQKSQLISFDPVDSVIVAAEG